MCANAKLSNSKGFQKKPSLDPSFPTDNPRNTWHTHVGFTVWPLQTSTYTTCAFHNQDTIVIWLNISSTVLSIITLKHSTTEPLLFKNMNISSQLSKVKCNIVSQIKNKKKWYRKLSLKYTWDENHVLTNSK